MAYLISFTLIVLIKIYAAASSFHGTPVPALLWSPERSLSLLPEITGMDPVKTEDFLQGYLTPVMTNGAESAVVFIQDQLNLEHFTKYADVYSLDSDGGAFKNVKSLMEDHFSLELPQVANPSKAIEKLKASFTGAVHTVKSVEEVEALTLDKDKRVLIIVQLKPVRGHNDHENIIQQNDAIIGAITRHLQKRNVKYSALFTGQSSSDGQADSAESRLNRHLLAATDSVNGTFFNESDGNIFVYIRSASLYLQIDKEKGKAITMNLTLTPSTASNSTYNNETSIVRLDFPNVSANGTEYNVSIVTEAERYTDRWVMSVSLYVEGGVAPDSNVSLQNASLSSGENDFVIPIIYSWHCTEMKLFLDTVNYPNSRFAGSYILLDGYQ
ncbi:unnamed protein product, partial [Candidula unifasciata]